MKVYLCGPMTGYVDHNRPAFHAAAAHLRARGWEVVNPAELDESMDVDGWGHEMFMRRDLRLLLDCDAIYPLPGSDYSPGARLELSVAAGTGLVELWDDDPTLWRTFEGEPLEESPEATCAPTGPRVDSRGHTSENCCGSPYGGAA